MNDDMNNIFITVTGRAKPSPYIQLNIYMVFLNSSTGKYGEYKNFHKKKRFQFGVKDVDYQQNNVFIKSHITKGHIVFTLSTTQADQIKARKGRHKEMQRLFIRGTNLD